MPDYPVTCPLCSEEFDADVPAEALALAPDAEDPFTIDCPECGEEFSIVYDAASNTVTLVDDLSDEEETELTDEEPEGDEE